MPLNSSQALQSNIINSLKDFINTNIITPYNTQVASSNYPAPCSIGLAYPDDPDIFTEVPRIILELPLTDVGQTYGTGAGDGLVWRNKQVYVTVYPAVTASGKPSVQAMNVMMSLFDYALGTCLYIPIKDYTQSGNPQVDCAQVVNPRIIRPRGKSDPTLALERHRFDYQFILMYAQTTING